jgi:hypothetical protein
MGIGIAVRRLMRMHCTPYHQEAMPIISLSIVLDVENLDGTGLRLVRVFSHRRRNQQQLSHNFVFHDDEGSMKYPFFFYRSDPVFRQLLNVRNRTNLKQRTIVDNIIIQEPSKLPLFPSSFSASGGSRGFREVLLLLLESSWLV